MNGNCLQPVSWCSYHQHYQFSLYSVKPNEPSHALKLFLRISHTPYNSKHKHADKMRCRIFGELVSTNKIFPWMGGIVAWFFTSPCAPKCRINILYENVANVLVYQHFGVWMKMIVAVQILGIVNCRNCYGNREWLMYQKLKIWNAYCDVCQTDSATYCADKVGSCYCQVIMDLENFIRWQH